MILPVNSSITNDDNILAYKRYITLRVTRLVHQIFWDKNLMAGSPLF